MRILFVTRKYPPIVGGMERYSKELFDALSAVARVDLCANERGNKVLPFFLIQAALRLAARARRYDAIHFGDGLLACLLPVVRLFSRTPVTITVHGLDVTFSHPLYRVAVLPWLRRADKVICISRNTRTLCLERGLSAERIVVIPNGIARKHCASVGVSRPAALPSAIDETKILLTVGRLVRRKGHEWFVRNVMRRLDVDFVYVVAGDGPERPRIDQAVAELGLHGRVFLLGQVSEDEKEWLFGHARLFVMPNVPVPGDVEGFGLALIEAASCGLMAVASDLDGIPDAAIPGETAVLVPALDAEAFAEAIMRVEPDRERVAMAASSFAWERVVGRYLDAMRSVQRRISS
jgi:glycosyltransferase involved in cell wall biosynthesis